MSNAIVGNPFLYLICAAGNAIFCSGEKEMPSGIFLFFIAFLFLPYWAPEDELIMLCLQVFLESHQLMATTGVSWESPVSHLAPGVDHTLPKAHLNPASAREWLGFPNLDRDPFKTISRLKTMQHLQSQHPQHLLLQDLLKCSWEASHFGW